jgi:cell division protein FtsB
MAGRAPRKPGGPPRRSPSGASAGAARKSAAVRRPDQRRRTPGTGTPASRAAAPGSRRTAVTTRAAILGVVLFVLALALTVPLRQYVAQRGRVARLRAAEAAQQRRVDALEARKQRLQDPAYVEQLARERLHFVRPGEVPYILLTPTPTPVPVKPGTPGVTKVGGTGPWFSRLWGTVETAGRAPTPKPAPKPTR